MHFVFLYVEDAPSKNHTKLDYRPMPKVTNIAIKIKITFSHSRELIAKVLMGNLELIHTALASVG